MSPEKEMKWDLIWWTCKTWIWCGHSSPSIKILLKVVWRNIIPIIYYRSIVNTSSERMKRSSAVSNIAPLILLFLKVEDLIHLLSVENNHTMRTEEFWCTLIPRLRFLIKYKNLALPHYWTTRNIFPLFFEQYFGKKTF